MASEKNKTLTHQNIYNNILISQKIQLNIKYVGGNLKQTLEKILVAKHTGRCIVEGFVKPGTIKILSYSSGKLNSNNVLFDVVFECKVCSPVEGMLIDCVVKNITKAGIKAEVDDSPSPLIIFLARDHHQTSSYFNSMEVDRKIKIRVLGQRYELNDEYVSVIGELIESYEQKGKERIKNKGKKKPKLVLVKEDEN